MPFTLASMNVFISAQTFFNIFYLYGGPSTSEWKQVKYPLYPHLTWIFTTIDFMVDNGKITFSLAHRTQCVSLQTFLTKTFYSRPCLSLLLVLVWLKWRKCDYIQLFPAAFQANHSRTRFIRLIFPLLSSIRTDGHSGSKHRYYWTFARRYNSSEILFLVAVVVLLLILAFDICVQLMTVIDWTINNVICWQKDTLANNGTKRPTEQWLCVIYLTSK